MPSQGENMTVLGTQIFAFCNQRLSLCFHVSGLKAFHMLPFHFLMKGMQILRMLPPTPPGAAKAGSNKMGTIPIKLLVAPSPRTDVSFPYQRNAELTQSFLSIALSV
jgi:hypothetical protein